MSKYTANTTLSFHGQVLARAGKTFDGSGLPSHVLQGWAEKGLCSPVSSRAKSRKATTASCQAKQADTNIKESKNGSKRK
jgi:hypothetical protein